MVELDRLATIGGEWAGDNRVLLPGEPPHESASTACLTVARNKRSFSLIYTWAFDGEPHDGVLVYVLADDGESVQAAFIDTWHMAGQIMLCQGVAEATSVFDVRGAYAVPGNPDWGWRIVLEVGNDSLRLTMYNVTPDGQEFLGVETNLTRQK